MPLTKNKENGKKRIDMRKVRKLLRLFISNQKGESIAFHKDHRTKLLCHWLSGLEYKTHMLNWVECNEEVSVKNQGVIKGQRFVHITNMELKIGRASCRERV